MTLEIAIDVLHAADARTLTLQGKWSVKSEAALDAVRLTLRVKRYSENVPLVDSHLKLPQTSASMFKNNWRRFEARDGRSKENSLVRMHCTGGQRVTLSVRCNRRSKENVPFPWSGQIDARFFLNIDAVACGYSRCESTGYVTVHKAHHKHYINDGQTIIR